MPSPIATGGGGERFEQRVDAYALALLLVGAVPPILLDSTVVEVSLQTKNLGWQTDDLLIIAQTSTGVTRKLAIQAKRTFTVSVANEECVKTVCGMWDDFVARDRFNPELDRLAIATLHGTSTLLRHFVSLLDCARAAMSGEDFRRRLRLKGYLAGKAHEQHDALLAILREHTGTPFSEDAYWQFLRVVAVLSLDLGTTTSLTDASILSLLAYVAGGAADPTATARTSWLRLLDVASEGRQAAAMFTRKSLPPDLCELHAAIASADHRALRNLIDHGRTVRDSIRATIAGFTLDRSSSAGDLLEQLESASVVVVCGAAGAGKSALVKKLLAHSEGERPVLAFQAVEFAKAHLDETLASVSLGLNVRSLLALVAASDNIIVFVDGVERLLEHSVRDAFTQLLQVASSRPSVRLVLTCRDYSLDTVRTALLGQAGLNHRVFEVPAVTDDELDGLAKGVPQLDTPLRDSYLRSFLRTPYLLDVASRLQWSDSTLPQDSRAFRQKCWREVVCDESHPASGMPQRRGIVFSAVARQRAAELRPFIRIGDHDPEAVAALRAASVLVRSPESDSLVAPAHDVLEDWAILSWMDDTAESADDIPAALSGAVGGLPAMRRGLRRWLGERLEIDPSITQSLVLPALSRSELPQHFRDDCAVAALLSNGAAEFVKGCRALVAAGDIALLRKVIHLLRVGCKIAPFGLPPGSLPSTLLVPVGPGWAPTLELASDCVEQIAAGDSMLLLGLIEDWAREVTVNDSPPDGAHAAGRILAALLPLFDDYNSDGARKRALEVLLKIPGQAPIFGELAARALLGNRKDSLARTFSDIIVSTTACAWACRGEPDVVMNILRTRFTMDESDLTGHYAHAREVSSCFGIRGGGMSDFFPASALHGPFRACKEISDLARRS